MKFEETLEEEYVDMGYDEEDQIASKYVEFHYIELPKYKKKNPSKFTKLDQWMCVLTNRKRSRRKLEEKRHNQEKL